MRDKIETTVFVLFFLLAVWACLMTFFIHSEDNHFQRSCREAGGIPGKIPHLCLHPNSVIRLKEGK